MKPVPIVKDFYLFKDYCFCFIYGLKLLVPQPFTFQFTPKRLYRSIIPTVAFTTHTAYKTYVMSETHFWQGLSELKSLFRIFSATGRLWFESVVWGLYFFAVLDLIPLAFIILYTLPSLAFISLGKIFVMRLYPYILCFFSWSSFIFSRSFSFSICCLLLGLLSQA